MLKPKNNLYIPNLAENGTDNQSQVFVSDESTDWIAADMSLGIVVQEYFTTRDELVAYCEEESLVPYLRFFLERRGWFDDDWERRLTRLEADLCRQIN